LQSLLLPSSYLAITETPQEKKARKEDLDARNALREPEDRKRWEIQQAEKLEAYIKRYNRRPRGKRVKWKHCKAIGAYVVKKGQGGINWYRY
jgi:hypothetical protein